MSFETFEELEVLCPNCGSNNVVIELQFGYYYFSKCNKCGFEKKQINFNNINS